MFIHVQTCLLSNVITSGNRELPFRSHNAIDLGRGHKRHFEKFRPSGDILIPVTWSVRDCNGITRFFHGHQSRREFIWIAQKKFQKLLRRLVPSTFLIRFLAFRDQLREEFPHVQIFMNVGPNTLT